MSDADHMTEEQRSAGIRFALDMIHQLPQGDRAALEAHISGVLIVFWGALWGTFGTEYARGFIEGQLRGMQGKPETYVREIH